MAFSNVKSGTQLFQPGLSLWLSQLQASPSLGGGSSELLLVVIHVMGR